MIRTDSHASPFNMTRTGAGSRTRAHLTQLMRCPMTHNHHAIIILLCRQTQLHVITMRCRLTRALSHDSHSRPFHTTRTHAHLTQLMRFLGEHTTALVVIIRLSSTHRRLLNLRQLMQCPLRTHNHHAIIILLFLQTRSFRPIETHVLSTRLSSKPI